MEEDEILFAQVIKDSNNKLVDLKLLANFFSNETFISILIRTTVIHNLFESNRTLDINKLDLFHIQYTNSLMELFLKLKKSKEQQYLIISDEMNINNDFIRKLESEVGQVRFPELMRSHSKIMSEKIQALYEMLASDKIDIFSWDEILKVSNSVRLTYYREITIDQYTQLTCSNLSFYQNSLVKVEKKLLGKLNICRFRIKFLCGLVCNNEIIEVYEFIDSNDKFIFVNNDKSFHPLEPANEKGIDLTKNTSRNTQIMNQLSAKNEILKEKLSKVKTSLTLDVQNVLKSYLDKISSVDFLDELQNVDEQTNILKAMLNININSK